MASKSLNSVGFFDLPREIRDIIYCDLLTSGHIAILRTSRAVHWEASTFISKEGVLRCTILARRQPHSLCFQNLNLVQNLDIHLDLWNIYYKEIPKFLRTLRDFEGSSIPRQTLRITLLDSRSARPASNNGRQRLLLEQLTAFTGFEKITVNHMARDALGNPPHLLEVVGKPFNGLELGVNRACWELMDKVVSSVLGPAIWHKGEGHRGLWVEFRPRRYQAALFTMGTPALIAEKCKASLDGHFEGFNLFRMVCSLVV